MTSTSPCVMRGTRDVRRLSRAVCGTLRAAGAGRISDSFLTPESSVLPGAGPRSVLSTRVLYRGHGEGFFVRAADVPFDLLPYRACDPARQGAWFNVGPGVAGRSLEAGVHPAVLLLQVEGPPDEVLGQMKVLRDRAEDVLSDVVVGEVEDAPGWWRLCLAGRVGSPAWRIPLWTGTS